MEATLMRSGVEVRRQRFQVAVARSSGSRSGSKAASESSVSASLRLLAIPRRHLHNGLVSLALLHK